MLALLKLPLLPRAVVHMCHVQGFEIGSGFSGARMTGSEHNDPFFMENGAVRTRSNRCADLSAPADTSQQCFACVLASGAAMQAVARMLAHLLVCGFQQGLHSTRWLAQSEPCAAVGA